LQILYIIHGYADLAIW